MTTRPDELRARAEDWFAAAGQSGWLDPAAASALARIEAGDARELFESQQRPLVVAFFGGTGVGKSSLLNRLAGAAVARTGVERPTSHEVTLYAHRQLALTRLPDGCPLDRVQQAGHERDRWRDVLWIDMPDIDSTAEENRRLALAWVPFVDLLVYVVSPERYRDDAGWRVLRERRDRHGWLFLLNRFDEGDPAQAEDLRALLRTAGFDDPLVLCTVADPRRLPRPGDQFPDLESLLDDLLRLHAVRDLERRGAAERLRELGRALKQAEAALGDPAAVERPSLMWREAWDQTAAAIVDGLGYPIDTLAEGLSRQSERFWERLLTRSTALVAQAVIEARRDGPPTAPTPTPAFAPPPTEPPGQLDAAVAALWDGWARQRAAAAIDRFAADVLRIGWPPEPFRVALAAALPDADETMRQRLSERFRSGMLRPGAAWRRILLRISRFLTGALPLAALLWIAWHVVQGFAAGVAGRAAFFDSSFLTHSLLLVGVAWGAPLAATQFLRPDRAAAARDALQAGLRAGLAEIESAGAQAIQNVLAERRTRLAELRAMLAEIDRARTAQTVAPSPAVARLLTRERVEDARPSEANRA